MRIATEEACSFPEIVSEMGLVAARGGTNLDMELITAIYGPNAPEVGRRAVAPLLDVGAGRIAEMDRAGVDMHVLSLTSPGVQMFAPDRAVALAELANDKLAAAIRRYPTRFAGLAAVAPQNPQAAAREMERAINRLRLNGFIINSHTDNRYLDEEFFWPILEAAEALDRPIYIHPRNPSDGMAGPFRGVSLPGYAFGMETSVHALRLLFRGVFDRFPKLKIVLGHMGEGIHFWQARLDRRYLSSSYASGYVRLSLMPSEYLKRNFAITTSGAESHEALEYSIKTLGADHVMWAIDYPYEPTQSAVDFLESAPITPEQKAMIFEQNAERVFHIERPAPRRRR
ncbi:MAG: amidohydrolase [Hyphomonadaceae bacterium]|nr:amidohydrolase [Hyphomonadaceae bacterium]